MNKEVKWTGEFMFNPIINHPQEEEQARLVYNQKNITSDWMKSSYVMQIANLTSGDDLGAKYESSYVIGKEN